MDYVWGQGISVLCWSHIGDGNMKELWDFNRSSAKSYLFFLIYFHVIALGVQPGAKDLWNKSIRDEVGNKQVFSRASFGECIRGVTIKPWKPKGVN